MHERVMTIATKEVKTIPAKSTIMNALKLMLKHNFRRMPIADPGTKKLMGIVTTTDLINFFGGGRKYNLVKNRFNEVDRPLVVISRQYCVLDKERAKEFLPGIFATVDEEKCVACDVCTTQYVCPPMHYNERGKIEIDPLLCIGCGVCISGICPSDAFVRREK